MTPDEVQKWIDERHPWGREDKLVNVVETMLSLSDDIEEWTDPAGIRRHLQLLAANVRVLAMEMKEREPPWRE